MSGSYEECQHNYESDAKRDVGNGIENPSAADWPMPNMEFSNLPNIFEILLYAVTMTKTGRIKANGK